MNIILKLFEMLFSLVEASLKLLFESIEMLIANIPKKKHEYSATFAPASTLLSKDFKGFNLTGNRCLSVKNSYQNCIIIGGTGSGKTSVTLIPSLYAMKSSFVVNDPSGELFAKTGGFLAQQGYEVKILHFANPAVSVGYNPMARASNSSDIHKLSSILIENSIGGKESKEAFWNLQASALITMLISILKTQEKKFQHLYNVRLLLNYLSGSPKAMDQIFSEYADHVLFSEYKSFLNFEEKTVAGIIANCKATLSIFNDENVAKVTSCDSIDFNDFRKRKTALFIQNSISDQKYYSALTSIFFEQFFAYILSRFPAENELDIFFLIDEASALKLPTLQMAISNCRKHRAGIMLVVQDFHQLIHVYGKDQAEAIKSNCFAKMFFSGAGIETATELERLLGKYEFTNKEKRKQIRPLMTADEIRTMKKSNALLICGNHAPVLAKLKPYYENGRYRNYDKISLPVMKSSIESSEIPILTLEEEIPQ